jgi:hypothetical protein
MPMTSKAQWRHMFAAEQRGEVPPGTAEEMASETPGGYHSLPEYAATSGDLLPGGLGDELDAGDVDPAQLARGLRVEQEHTSNPAIAREIALDHLAEIPDYYTRLAKMEAAASAGEAMNATGTASIPYRVMELPNGNLVGFATVQTGLGPVTVTATASPSEEAQKMLAILRQGGVTAGFLGGLFKKIVKTVTSPIKATIDVAKNLAHGRIKKALGAAVKHVTNLPIVKQALPIVTKSPIIRQALGAASSVFLGPMGPMVVPAALRMAGNLVERAQKGDRRANHQIKNVVMAARRGNRRARAMLPHLRKARAIARRHPNFFAKAQRQAARLAQLRARRMRQQARYWGRGRGWGRGRSAGEELENGNWVQTPQGDVFVPHAYAGSLLGGLIEELKPRTGYRSEQQALTLREAYRRGLRAA